VRTLNWTLLYRKSAIARIETSGVTNHDAVLNLIIISPPSEQSYWRRYCIHQIDVCLSVYIAVNRSVVNQTVWVLNANCSSTVIATDFKFDTRFQSQSGHDPLKFMESGRGHGHLSTKLDTGVKNMRPEDKLIIIISNLFLKYRPLMVWIPSMWSVWTADRREWECYCLFMSDYEFVVCHQYCTVVLSSSHRWLFHITYHVCILQCICDDAMGCFSAYICKCFESRETDDSYLIPWLTLVQFTAE